MDRPIVFDEDGRARVTKDVGEALIAAYPDSISAERDETDEVTEQEDFNPHAITGSKVTNE